MIGNVLNRQMLPGVGIDLAAPKRELYFSAPQSWMYFPVGLAIDGANCSDPGNPINQYILRAGLILGKITASGQLGASIIGVSLAALANGGTTLYADGPTITELVRRLGASGTFKLTGPPAASGTVRTVTVTYSATASNGGNDAKICTPNGTASSGTFTITLYLSPSLAPGGRSDYTVTTAAIAYTATPATIQAAINAVLGASAVTVTMSGTQTFNGCTYLTIAFTGAPYSTVAQPDPSFTCTSLGTVTAVAISYPDYITITAPSVNEVQTVNFGYLLSAGSFSIAILTAAGVWKKTPACAYNDSASTIQAFLDTATGVSNGIVITCVTASTVAGGFVLTYSGTGYAGLPQTLAVVDLTGTAMVSGATGASVSVTRTTLGVDGRFIAGSWIQPVDGSETPFCLFDDAWGYWLVHPITLQRISIQMPRIPTSGKIRTAMIVNYPSDASMVTYLKAKLRALGGMLLFDDDFMPGTV